MDKKSEGIYIRVSPEERKELKKNCEKEQISMSMLLTYSALNKQIYSSFDFQQVEKLLKVKVDLGRLGGLLKILLKQDNLDRNLEIAVDLLKKIYEHQEEIEQILKKVLR